MSPCIQFPHLFYMPAHSVLIIPRLHYRISKGKAMVYRVLVFPSANMEAGSLINRLYRLHPTIRSVQLLPKTFFR